MNVKVTWTLVSVLVILGLIMGGFGCAKAPAPAPAPTPTAAPKPAPAPAPTPTAAPKPAPSPTPSPAPAAKPEVIRWKGQNGYVTAASPVKWVPGNVSGGAFGADWADWVAKVTNGRLVIDLAQPGAIVPVSEMFTAVSKGTLDVGATYSGFYHAGIMPEADLESYVIPWGIQSVVEMVDLFYNRAYNLYQESYNKNNVRWFPVPWTAVPAIMSTKPMNSAKDLKGIKIRAGAAMAEAFKVFGASPTLIPHAEIYMALKLGTLDAAAAGADLLYTTKLQEVVKYVVVSPVPAGGVASFIVNLDKWKALPADIRHILETDSVYRILETSQRIYLNDQAVIQVAARDYGVKIVTWPEEDRALLLDGAIKGMKAAAAGKPTFEKAVEIALQQLRDYGRIK